MPSAQKKVKTNRDLKSPNDYPLLGYRVKPHIKELLTEELEEILNMLNKKRSPLDGEIKKNELFVMALKKGMASLRQEVKDKKQAQIQKLEPIFQGVPLNKP